MTYSRWTRYAKKRLAIPLGLAAIAFLFIAGYLFVPVKDTFIGVPFDAKERPDELDENGFFTQFEVSCNRVYKREVGLLISPPIPIQSIRDAPTAASGTVTLTVTQGDKKLKKVVDLSTSGWAADSDGVWLKVISRYSPVGSVFCFSQEVAVKASGVNFDLQKHKVLVYVSRDRRI